MEESISAAAVQRSESLHVPPRTRAFKTGFLIQTAALWSEPAVRSGPIALLLSFGCISHRRSGVSLHFCEISVWNGHRVYVHDGKSDSLCETWQLLTEMYWRAIKIKDFIPTWGSNNTTNDKKTSSDFTVTTGLVLKFHRTTETQWWFDLMFSLDKAEQEVTAAGNTQEGRPSPGPSDWLFCSSLCTACCWLAD